MAIPALRQKTTCRPNRFSLEGPADDGTLLPDRDSVDHRDGDGADHRDGDDHHDGGGDE